MSAWPFPDWIDQNGWPRTPEQLLVHHRLMEWDIRPGEDVVIIGGFDGFTVGLIHEIYPEAIIHTFEPQQEFYRLLMNRFASEPEVHVYPWGLGIEDGIFPMVSSGTNAASFLTGDYQGVKPGAAADGSGELREFGRAMAELGIDELAWFHCNAEQYEFLLLPHLSQTRWLPRIGQLVVATHPFPGINDHPQAWPLWRIDSALSVTHRPMWSGYSWYAWSRFDRDIPDVRAKLIAAGVNLDGLV